MEREHLKRLKEIIPNLPPLSNAVISRKIEHGVEEVDYQGEEGVYRGTFCYKDRTIAVKQLTIPKGTTTARHGHNGDEHCLVYSGMIEVEHDGVTKVYGKGECFEIPHGEDHVGKALTRTKCIVMMLNGEDQGFPQETAERKS